MSIPTRSGIQTKPEIAAALRESMSAITAWTAAQPDAHFATGPVGRWSAGQHLAHLVSSVQPLTLGMGMPKFLLSFALVTMNRPSMSYLDLTTKYENALSAGGKASGRYVPPAVAASRKAALIRALNAQRDKVLRQLEKFTEADLDRFGGKHPLIGVLSLRELLFFTIHHHDHHLHTLQRDYAQ